MHYYNLGNAGPESDASGVELCVTRTPRPQTATVVGLIGDAPFDFEDQQIHPLDSVQIRDGDVLTTTCSYENDTGRTVRFGQNSDDEMCFNFVTHYPMGAFQCGLGR